MTPTKQRFDGAAGARDTALEGKPLYDPYLAAQGPLAGPPESVRSRRFERRRHRLLLLVAFSALATALVAVGLLGWGIYQFRDVLMNGLPAAEEDDESTTKRAALSADDEDDDSAGDDDSDDSSARDNVLPETRVKLIGDIEVVDVGVSEVALKDLLATQRQLAEVKSQTLVVMLTGRSCLPCKGVDESLSDPAMQQSLGGVRLLRVDMEVFREEIKQLHLPTNLYPSFFLFDESLNPIDAIHGGEWDDDVAENIAPVLGAFVRGKLQERRHYDWSPTTTGIRM